MLNAMKQLYGFIAMPFNEAVELLHCVQYDPFLPVITGRN